MAMHLGRKIFRQISAGRFVSAGTAGELGSSTGLAGATQSVRRYCHRSNTQSSENGFLSPETAGWVNNALPELKLLTVFLLGLTWYHQTRLLKIIGNGAKDIVQESDESLRKFLVEDGVNREFCEAKVAEFKQKTESGSGSECDRYELQRYERWLHVLTKGT